MAIFHVRFYNPQTKLLHSSAVVDVAHPADAVKAAVDHLQATRRGTDFAALSSYDAGVTDVNGNGVVGMERALSVAQITQRVQELQAQLALLTSDGQTEAQQEAVQSTIPGVQQVVAAPAPQNPAQVQPNLFTPPQNATPTSQEVTPGPAQQVNGGLFTQADVDRQIAEALKGQAEQARPAMG